MGIPVVTCILPQLLYSVHTLHGHDDAVVQ